jgi:hypothetical protein
VDNAFPLPVNLNKNITRVTDNRKPGDEIVIDAKLFVAVFRFELEAWYLKKMEAKERAAEAQAKQA